MKRESSDLRREEWDFSKVPREELAPCFIYEYARELTKQWPRLLRLLKIAKHYSKLPPKHPDGWKEDRIFQLLFRIFGRRFDECPQFWFFPDTAWQNIDKKRRLRWVEDLSDHRVPAYRIFKIHTLRELEAPNVRSIESFAYLHELFAKEELDQTEYGFFAIDWNYPDREIESAFKLWLNEQRQERTEIGFKIKNRKTSRGGFRDRLRRLGALRVINYYHPGDLANLPVKVVNNPSWKLKIPAPYSYLPDLYEAAAKAQLLIDEIRASRPRKPVKGQSLRGNLAIVRQFLYPESQ